MARKLAAPFDLPGRAFKPPWSLGLTFKPNTGDTRQAPAIPIITALQDMGAKVRAADTPEVTVNDTVRSVHENESIYIPVGSVHRLANQGRIPLKLIEVQTGSYLGGETSSGSRTCTGGSEGGDFWRPQRSRQ